MSESAPSSSSVTAAAAATASATPAGTSADSASFSEAERRQQLINMLIEQQREKERKRLEQLKIRQQNIKQNPIWERQKQFLEQKRANLVKLTAETVERESGSCSFAPKINARSRDMAAQARRVSNEI